jgi:hypothetical protein
MKESIRLPSLGDGEWFKDSEHRRGANLVRKISEMIDLK